MEVVKKLLAAGSQCPKPNNAFAMSCGRFCEICLCSSPWLGGGGCSAIIGVGNTDAIAINHLPTFPAGEQQDADNNERQHQALRYDCGASLGVASIKVI